MRRPREYDFRWIGSIVSRNGAIEETGLAAAVLNHPAMGIVWLANRLAAYRSSIAAGQLVQSGFFIRPVETAPGATITADCGPLGTIALVTLHRHKKVDLERTRPGSSYRFDGYLVISPTIELREAQHQESAPPL